jgi:hypothetical protein
MIITGPIGPEQTFADFYVPRALICIIFFEGISPSDSLWLPPFEAFAPIYVL